MSDVWRDAQREVARHHAGVAEQMASVAARAALRSGCRTSRRGAVIWNMATALSKQVDVALARETVLDDRFDIAILAHGTNYKPAPHRCDGTQACQDTCATTCIHAEDAAIRSLGIRHAPALLLDEPLGFHIIHVKVMADGSLAPRGEPSCVACSKTILDTKAIGVVWLAGCDGVRPYTSLDFHEASLTHPKNRLPVIR
jgi:hypothetical protein